MVPAHRLSGQDQLYYPVSGLSMKVTQRYWFSSSQRSIFCWERGRLVRIERGARTVIAIRSSKRSMLRTLCGSDARAPSVIFIDGTVDQYQRRLLVCERKPTARITISTSSTVQFSLSRTCRCHLVEMRRRIDSRYASRH